MNDLEKRDMQAMFRSMSPDEIAQWIEGMLPSGKLGLTVAILDDRWNKPQPVINCAYCGAVMFNMNVKCGCREQKAAQAEMDRLGWTYKDLGFGFHVDKFGVWKSPVEILNYVKHWNL